MTYKNNYIKPLSFKCCHVSLGGFWLCQRWKIDRADIVFKAYLGNGNHVRELIWNYPVDMSTRFNHAGSRQHTRGATDGLGCSAKIQIRSKHARGCSKALMSLNTAANVPLQIYSFSLWLAVFLMHFETIYSLIHSKRNSFSQNLSIIVI